MLAWLHEHVVYARRIEQLARALATILPRDARVLDVGSGDGRLARRVVDLRPDLRITGVDVLVRPQTLIPVTAFDGDHLPFPDASFDGVMLVDVLHHARHQVALLREITRVASRFVAIKDHVVRGIFARTRLKMMDWVGNARHGVALPYAYWTQAEWDRALEALGLRVTSRRDSLRLAPWPASLIFGGRLHFLALLEKT